MIRWLLSAVGLLVALAGIGIFIGTAIYAWSLRAETLRETESLAVRAEAAGSVADHVITLIREVIARAQAGIVAARADPANITAGKEPDPFVRLAMAKAKQDLPQQVERARDAVNLASEALLVAGAAIDVFEERPKDGSSLGIRPQDMQSARSELDRAALELRNARHVLGVPVASTPGGVTPEQLTQVDEALRRAKDLTDQMDAALDHAREKLNRAREQVELWSWRIAVGVTAAASLAALGQIFMARACWRGLRRRPEAVRDVS